MVMPEWNASNHIRNRVRKRAGRAVITTLAFAFVFLYLTVQEDGQNQYLIATSSTTNKPLSSQRSIVTGASSYHYYNNNNEAGRELRGVSSLQVAATATKTAADSDRLPAQSAYTETEPSVPNSISTTTTTTTTTAGQMEEFLQTYPDTPGARFVRYLRSHLHYEAGAEHNRMLACDMNRANKELPGPAVHCYAGMDINSKMTQVSQHNNGITRQYTMPLGSNITIHDMPLYATEDIQEKYIPALGTQQTCLPLFLAGAALDPTKNEVAVELGPYFGLSSKCIVAGMRTQGGGRPRNKGAHTYTAFDTFNGIRNHDSIRKHPEWNWILEKYPYYTAANTSFLFLWEKAVQSVYPTARGRAGWINSTTLNPAILGLENDDNNNKGSLGLISIDSAKTAIQLRDQLAGLGTLRAGTILFLLDFEFVVTQIKLVYGCLRHTGYLIPVYTAWERRENWAFVVAKDNFSWSDPRWVTCMDHIENATTTTSSSGSAGSNEIVVAAAEVKSRHAYWVKQDVVFMTSLQTSDTAEMDAVYQPRVDALVNAVLKTVDSHHWAPVLR